MGRGEGGREGRDVGCWTGEWRGGKGSEGKKEAFDREGGKGRERQLSKGVI